MNGAQSPSGSLCSLDEPYLSRDYSREDLILTHSSYGVVCIPPKMMEGTGGGSGDYTCVLSPGMTMWTLSRKQVCREYESSP